MKTKLVLKIFVFSFFLLAWSCSHPPVDFNTQIRPILNQKCLACHGGVKKNGGLSLRFLEDALAGGDSGKPAIVPGKPAKSELVKRLVHEDPEFRMPHEDTPLSREEVNMIKDWIQQGATWDTHWAYLPPDRNVKRAESNSNYNQIMDLLVAKELHNKGLEMNPSADRHTLLRRVSLDLIGLPPNLEEARAYLDDRSDNSYEQLVDRLLSSPHFGERWASLWLDLARYADSQGFQKDLLRPEMWRYRDWVIHALNRDMPFDSFTIVQLAGDLLPHPSDNDLLATAFHRNTMTNDEGGTDDEEFRVSAVLDRVNTTFEVWQASTVACVQCHDHPYDPFQHESYYRLVAFFNTTADADLTSDIPVIPLLSPAQKAMALQLKSQLDGYKSKGDSISFSYRDILNKSAQIKPGNVPVMQELPPDTNRMTHVFERGNWLVHGKAVEPDVPEFLPQIHDNDDPNRLDLAKWLVAEENPLTARVMVNRLWEQLFGIGLVRSVEDFGTQGSPPSNQELLDHLAVKFQFEFAWSIKRMLRYIVLSSTYRQSSSATDDLFTQDPDNITLARASRIRLSAEQIRDQGLQASGLLDPTVYGQSVMPYQPEGVWNVIRHTSRWKQSEGTDRYRRALYTFWRRVSPYPSMELFDAPSREYCVSRRIRTNTPVQALVTLNDPVYTEMAKALAERMNKEGGDSIAQQIAYGYRRLLFKSPDEDRLALLKQLYDDSLESFESTTMEDDLYVDAASFALFNVANAILNLDEVLMKS